MLKPYRAAEIIRKSLQRPGLLVHKAGGTDKRGKLSLIHAGNTFEIQFARPPESGSSLLHARPGNILRKNCTEDNFPGAFCRPPVAVPERGQKT